MTCRMFTTMCRKSFSKYVIRHFKIKDVFIYIACVHTFIFIHPKD